MVDFDIKVVNDLFGYLRPWVEGIMAILLFLFSVRLLGSTTDTLSPVIRSILENIILGDLSILGFSWVISYLLGNGSVVAALGISLFSAGLVNGSELFLLVGGSRLGAAGIVVFIGALDYFQKKHYTIGKSLSLGLLSFLITYTVYIPSIFVGYFLYRRFSILFVGFEFSLGLNIGYLGFIEDISLLLIDLLGPIIVLLLVIFLLFFSLKLFDSVFRSIDTEWIRENYFKKLQNKWISFGSGLLITAVTTSIAFSLGIIVPLYNRDYIKRKEIIPYILGANISTLIDTFIIAILLGTIEGGIIILFLIFVTIIITLSFLIFYKNYFDFIEQIQETIISDTKIIVLSLLLLIIIPLIFIFIR